MSLELSKQELADLVRGVFRLRAGDRALGGLCDLPDDALPDHPDWKARRELARSWVQMLREVAPGLGLERVDLVLYRNARRNNADLPELAWIHREGDVPDTADDLAGEGTPMEIVLSEHSVLLAPTELSATAPLKLQAKRLGFRAATMPQFRRDMIPALRLDWTEIDARCRALKERLDAADAVRIATRADGRDHELTLDLRHRTATASGGLMVEPGTAGNLPSGETYIVPYEGEIEGDASASEGTLPLQLDGELFVLRVEANKVVEVLGDGPVADRERREFRDEPAYANIAELGLGLLQSYGIEPVGSVLLDEKLGPHVAFGRSDHFGGRIGVADFSSPEKVIHIDRVYIPQMQPAVRVVAIDLIAPDGASSALMRDGRYV